MNTPVARRLSTNETDRLVGRAILAFREARGISLGALAKEAGVSEKTLRNVQAGTHSPRLSTLALIAAALGVEVAQLIERTAEEAA